MGIKSHPGELIGLGTPPVEADEAERVFPAAKAGDADAFRKFYMAVWLATMLQCQESEDPAPHPHRSHRAASGAAPSPIPTRSSWSPFAASPGSSRRG